jgi:hypothetical protein
VLGVDEMLVARLARLGPKPPDEAGQAAKKRYSERISEAVALVFAQELRERGLRGTRPLRDGTEEGSGAERRMAGGIGAKKVDVTWATEESGLLLGLSIKSINFRDPHTGNFQKNLTNRRGDMLMEAVTLHRRFPYAVLAGFFFLDVGAESDATQNRDGSARRRCTFLNAHARMKLFTGRDDPAGRDEQFERMYVLLLDTTPGQVVVRATEVGRPDTPMTLAAMFDTLVTLVAERNPDFYAAQDGCIAPAS